MLSSHPAAPDAYEVAEQPGEGRGKALDAAAVGELPTHSDMKYCSFRRTFRSALQKAAKVLLEVTLGQRTSCHICVHIAEQGQDYPGEALDAAAVGQLPAVKECASCCLSTFAKQEGMGLQITNFRVADCGHETALARPLMLLLLTGSLLGCMPARACPREQHSPQGEVHLNTAQLWTVQVLKHMTGCAGGMSGVLQAAGGEVCPSVLAAPFSLGRDIVGNSVCCANFQNPPWQEHCCRPLVGQSLEVGIPHPQTPGFKS